MVCTLLLYIYLVYLQILTPIARVLVATKISVKGKKGGWGCIKDKPVTEIKVAYRALVVHQQ